MEEQKDVQILEFSPDEASLGAEYAKRECNFRLDERFLRLLANKILMEMRKRSRSFEDVRYYTLCGAGLRNEEEFKAFSRALAKMFSVRRVARQKSQPKRERKSTRHTIKPVVGSREEENGQLAWKF